MNRHTRLAGLVAAVLAVVGASSAALSTSAQARPASVSTSAQAVSARIPALAHWQGPKPTVVLVHGAWADASGWTPEVKRLQAAGFPVVAPSNPLRGLNSDADYIHSVLERISGPIILVGHSYGGAVITNAVQGDPNVKALVYIAAFAPDQGDSLAGLNGSALGKEIPAVPVVPSTYPQVGGGTGTELTITTSQYPSVFLDNELPPSQEAALAAEQRPLSLDSVTEASGVPAWKTIPSWYMVATGDHAISPDLERFMAARAGAHTVEVDGPHLIMLTDPGAVTNLLEQAAVQTCQ
ncbi:alpha/beta hydrolase [Kitasatospora sp. NPDC001175]|uniref:alpha/beta hydrolase n=1 Tax=Kitasatospora sp. NPDC001175 TaxID=3157103 RepID=UPI003CFC5156